MRRSFNSSRSRSSVKTREEIFHRMIEITDIGRANTVMQPYNPDLDRNTLIEKVTHDVTRLGVRDFDGLQSFMDAFELYAISQGRKDVCDIHNLMWLRYRLGFDDDGRSRVPLFDDGKPDPVRLSNLHELVRNDAPIEKIADAVCDIIYRDLGEWPFDFMEKFGEFLLNNDRIDLAQSRELATKIRWTVEPYIPTYQSWGADAINDGAYSATVHRCLADKSYVDKAPFEYVARYILSDTRELAKLEKHETDGFWRMAGRVGAPRIKRRISEVKKNFDAGFSSWDEGAVYDNARYGDHLQKLKAVFALFDERATGFSEPEKTPKRAPTKPKKKSGEINLPKAQKKYKL